MNNEIVRCPRQRVTTSGTGCINMIVSEGIRRIMTASVTKSMTENNDSGRPSCEEKSQNLWLYQVRAHRMIDQWVCWSHICCIYQMMSLGVLIRRRSRPQDPSKRQSGGGCRRRQRHPWSLLKMLSSSLDIASDHGFTRPNRFLWCFWRHKGRVNHDQKHFLRY